MCASKREQNGNQKEKQKIRINSRMYSDDLMVGKGPSLLPCGIREEREVKFISNCLSSTILLLELEVMNNCFILLSFLSIFRSPFLYFY